MVERMWLKIAGLALAASILPLSACAQSSAQDAGPSGDVRAKMDAVRSDAKASALAAVSDAHRTKVQSIVDAFDADGSTLTVADASAQIDAVLTPEESSAVLAEQQKMRDAMRAALAGAPDGAGHHGGFGGGGGRRAPDAGRFLLQVDASPERFREAMRAERGNG
jgi:hypothetical protein